MTAGADKLKEKHLSEEDGEEEVETMTQTMDSEEVSDVVSNIEDIFSESRPQKINKSLKKYFKYTKSELQETRDAKLVKEHLKKNYIEKKIKQK